MCFSAERSVDVRFFVAVVPVVLPTFSLKGVHSLSRGDGNGNVLCMGDCKPVRRDFLRIRRKRHPASVAATIPIAILIESFLFLSRPKFGESEVFF